MIEKKKGEKDNNTVLGILAILFWGSTVAFSRSLTEQLGPITTGVLIFIFSGLLSLLFLLIQSPKYLIKMFKLPANYLWGCGSLFVLYMLSLYLAIGLALSRQQAIEISIINYLWPGLTLLFSVPVLKNRARFTIIPGIIIGFVGVYIAMNSPHGDASIHHFSENINNNIIPYALAFVAAISWALYSTLSRKWASQNEEGAVPLFLLITGIILLVVMVFLKEDSFWNSRVVLELIYMVIFPTFLAYSFWDKAMRKGNIILVASLSYLTPILSVFISSIYLKTNVGFRLWFASFLVVIGALISKYSITES